MRVRACCSAHVCQAHGRTVGFESGGYYLLNISAASGVVELGAAAGTIAHIARQQVPQPVSAQCRVSV